MTITPFLSYITVSNGSLIISDTAPAGFISFNYKYLYGETNYTFELTVSCSNILWQEIPETNLVDIELNETRIIEVPLTLALDSNENSYSSRGCVEYAQTSIQGNP